MQISQRENGMCEIIDIHTHILPETDDGARGIQESIQLIEQAAAQGITGMIATPHFSRHQSVSSLKMKLSTLREEVKKHNPDFQLYLGQEETINPSGGSEKTQSRFSIISRTGKFLS